MPNYAAAGSINETQSIPSVRKLDQAKNFTIEVEDSTGNMTAEQVKAAITFESPSNPDFAGITVTWPCGTCKKVCTMYQINGKHHTHFLLFSNLA